MVLESYLTVPCTIHSETPWVNGFVNINIYHDIQARKVPRHPGMYRQLKYTDMDAHILFWSTKTVDQ